MDYVKLHARMPEDRDSFFDDADFGAAFLKFLAGDDADIRFLAAHAVWSGKATAFQQKIAPKLPEEDRLIAAFLIKRYLLDTSPKQINVSKSLVKQALSGKLEATAFRPLADAAWGNLTEPYSRFQPFVLKEARAAVLPKVRQHQKGKIDGFAIVGGKHPSGRYAVFSSTQQLLLVSSAQGKAIDDKYLKLAETVGCKPTGTGIWVQEGKGDARTFTISSGGDVANFEAALTAMGVKGKVVGSNTEGVNQKIAVIDPKKSELVQKSKEIDKQLKPKSKKVTIKPTILASRPAEGEDTADGAWKSAAALMARLMDKSLVTRAASIYQSSKEPDKLEKTVTKGNFWVVLYADPTQLGEHADAFYGLYLYRGDKKPVPGAKPPANAIKTGWVPLVTQGHLLKDLLAQNGMM